jgi:hypothetical protein
LYGAFVWARRAHNSQKRRFPARAVLRREGPGWWRAAGGAQRCIAGLSAAATAGSCSRVCAAGPGMLEHLEEAAGERAAEAQNKSARVSSDG